MGIKSPLTNLENCVLIRTIESKYIIDVYNKLFKMDVSCFFEANKNIFIYKCLDTEFEFFFPFNLAGDEDYYKQMGKFPWYYNPSRWEHDKVLSLIKNEDCLLEVGAGPGFFLNRIIKDKLATAVGLELNNDAIIQAKSNGIDIIPEPVQEFSLRNKEKFDVVCSFQVLEHISDPIPFLKSSVDCLKEGGALYIGVPNNDSYMKDNIMDNRVLNMPPHHVGLWNEKSLKSLEKFLPIKFEEVYFEPLVGANINVYLWNKLNKIVPSEIICKVLWKLKINILLRFLLYVYPNNVRGNSVVVKYIKKS